MAQFRGFPEGKTRLTRLPEPFFDQLLPHIDDLEELKVTVYIFWRLDHSEGPFRYVSAKDISEDENFMQGLAENPEAARVALEAALERAVNRGTLLKARLALQDGEANLYFLNSPRGRAAVHAITSGQWHPLVEEQPALPPREPPNIYKLYEENIGPMTPMMADNLRDAEATYPAEWIEDAIRIAVERNKRSWNYAAAILKRWQQEGRDEQKDRRDSEKDRRRYIEGEYADFIEH